MTRVIAIVTVCTTLALGCTTPQSHRDSGDENKAVVRAYIERIINGGDWSAWDELFLETVSFNGQSMSRGDMDTMVTTFGSILSGYRIEVESQVAEGEYVASRVTIYGTHDGDYMGIKATGQDVSIRGLTYDRIADGKVVEMWHEMDIWGTLLLSDD